MNKAIAVAAVIALISGAMLAGSDQLLPPLLTVVFAISACVTITGLLKRKEGRR